MTPPTLSKKQQKRALSGKKSRKECVRNILANPYSKYWPQLNTADSETLQEVLSKHLPKLKDGASVPWSVLKDVPKQERKEFRAKHKSEFRPDADDNEHLTVGVNAVTRRLEQNKIISVLVAAEVFPQFMVQHVVDLCVNNNVPILIVPKLKETLKTRVGISSLAIGLEATLKRDAPLWIINETISTVAARYAVPKNYRRAAVCVAPASPERVVKTIDRSVTETIVPADVFLRRSCTKLRTFVPARSNRVHVVEADMDVESTNFLAFKKDDCEPSVIYKPLTVNRVRGNSKRVSKKRK